MLTPDLDQLNATAAFLRTVLAAVEAQIEVAAGPTIPAKPVAGRLDRSWLTLAKAFTPAEMLGWSGVYWYRPPDGPGSTLNNERQWYLNPRFGPTAAFAGQVAKVEGDALVLTTMRTPAAIKPLIGWPDAEHPQQRLGAVEYVSGLRQSRGSFERPGYGYWEAEMQLPKGQGVWPAFWLMPAEPRAPSKDVAAFPEIDVMEAVNDPRVIHQTLHTDAGGGQRVSKGSEFHGVDGSDGFHRYGVLVGRDAVVFYVDDVETFRQPAPAEVDQPFYILLNLAFGGSWPEQAGPVDPGVLPASLKVRRVAVFDVR